MDTPMNQDYLPPAINHNQLSNQEIEDNFFANDEDPALAPPPVLVPFSSHPFGFGAPLSATGHGGSNLNWGTADLNGPAINHPAFQNVGPQGIVNHLDPGVQMIVPPVQTNLAPYTTPGGAGFPHVLEAEYRNASLVEFLMQWSRDSTSMSSVGPPYPQAVLRVLRRKITATRYSDLSGDLNDMQAINWSMLGVTRTAGRLHRNKTYLNHVTSPGTDVPKTTDDNRIPSHENYFRFRRADHLDNLRLSHFQLRNSLASPTRTQAFYPTRGGVRCINPLTGTTTLPIKVRHGACFTSIITGRGILMAGSLNGAYYIKSLHAEVEDEPLDGMISRDTHAITNHLDMYTSRSSDAPHVGICSNDHYFRIMDLGTQTIMTNSRSELPFNCSAVSKDGRLRAMVGDLSPVVICDADSGKPVQTLSGHRDHGFACAWSDDGWTLATGNQDKQLCIWDARKWCDSNGQGTPRTTIWSEIAGVRSLKFSPAGSGKPVLVAAEEADFINVIDAQTYKSKQTIDIFGAIGGVDFTNEGRDLNVLCVDPTRGGLLQFERCAMEPEPVLEWQQEQLWNNGPNRLHDLRPDGAKETERRDLKLDTMEIF